MRLDSEALKVLDSIMNTADDLGPCHVDGGGRPNIREGLCDLVIEGKNLRK